MMQDKWRFYIKPFDADGNYTDWVEVTDDVILDSLGAIKENLDNVDYDVGIYRNASIGLKLRNDHGRYSDVSVTQSIFRYKRADSLIKITYQIEMSEPLCGVALVGDSYLDDNEVYEVFVGILNDDSLAMDIDNQFVQFQCLGRDSVLDAMKVPIGSISNGQSISTILYTCLNQAPFTDLVTVSAPNISVNNDIAVDDVSKFENKTVRQAVNELLLAGNSVMFVESTAIYVQPRTATVSVQGTFYGQASTQGVENISTIKQVRNGLSRTFNLWVWANTALYAEEASSIDHYGVRRKELDLSWCTNNTRRGSVLTALKNEFGNPKMELDLYTPFTVGMLSLGLLDRVVVDYPTVYLQGENELPICGVAVCGSAILPRALWAFTLDDTRPMKIIGREIDLKASQVKFKLREI